jgi:hypothetical protein
MECIVSQGFHEMYEQYHETFKDLFRKMNVVSDIGTLSLDEWEAIGISPFYPK